jgi:hypothetical protein
MYILLDFTYKYHVYIYSYILYYHIHVRTSKYIQTHITINVSFTFYNIFKIVQRKYTPLRRLRIRMFHIFITIF